MAGPLQTVAQTSSAAATLVFTVAATKIGSLLVIGWAHDTNNISGISGGGSWAVAKDAGGAHLIASEWRAVCTSSVTTITITWTASTGTAAAVFEEFPLCLIVSPLGATVNSVGGASTAPAVGPLTPVATENLLTAMVAHRGTFSSGPSGGYSDGGVEAAIGTVKVRLAWKEQNTATAGTCGWTLSGAANWDTAAAEFKRAPNPAAYDSTEPTDQIVGA